jgi:hypothetical protein
LFNEVLKKVDPSAAPVEADDASDTEPPFDADVPEASEAPDETMAEAAVADDAPKTTTKAKGRRK